jgi:hypothetical protein
MLEDMIFAFFIGKVFKYDDRLANGIVIGEEDVRDNLFVLIIAILN